MSFARKVKRNKAKKLYKKYESNTDKRILKTFSEYWKKIKEDI